MVGKIWIAFFLSLAGVTTLAWFFAFLRDKGIRPERGLADFIGEQPGLGRAVFVALFVGMCMYAGSKSAGGGGGSGGGNTNDVQMVQNPAGIGGGGGLLQMGGFRGSSLPITSTNTTRTLDLEDFGRGFVMSRIGTDEVFDFVPASNPDKDGDGLATIDEIFVYGTDPALFDTDDDGLSDLEEVQTGTDPWKPDTDGDGLYDVEEVELGTNPLSADSDSDGMSDGEELHLRGTDPLLSDTDGDGLPDAVEIVGESDPTKADTDGDGLDDGEEVGCFRRRYAQEGEWASATNGWSAVEIVNEEGFNLYWFTIWDGTLRIGNEEVFDVYCQWNGLVLVGSDICYPEDAVWLSPVDLAGAFVSEAALAIAPYWSEELVDSVAPAVSVFERGEGGNVSFAIQYAALPAGGTNTVSFQVTLVFTNGVYKATEILYGADSSAGLDGLNASIGVQDTIKSVKWSAGFHQLASLNPLRVMQFVQGAGTDPLDEVVDSDGDGLSDDLELIIGTDPHQPDTDGDGMHDGWECAYSFDPLEDNDDASIDADSDNDSCADPDEDGLTNKEEADWGTDPYDEDTDADGVPDGEEVENSSDPNDETDGGRPASRVPVDFTFGDPSGSHSEKYRLVVKPVKDPDGRKPVSGEEPKTFSWVDAEYGECETKTAMLQRGWTYEVRMFHAGTNIEDGDPDYDYSLTCSPPSCVGVVTADPEGLFQSFDDTSDYFSGKSKVAHILVLDGCLVGDYDRKDGFTDYDLSRVYRNKPLRHWINDDDDSGDTNDSDHDTPGAPGMPRQKPTATLPGGPVMPGSEEPFSVPYLVADWSNDHVDGKCDILDFTPVWMDMGVALQQLSRFSGNGGFELYLSCDEGSVNVVWTSLTTNNVSVFLTNAVSGCGRNLDKSLETAGTVHLTDKETKVPDVFLAAMRDDRRNGVFLLEGCKVDGKDIATSPIVLRCYKKPRASDAQPLFELKLPLSISPVEDMFRWKSFRSAAGEEGLKTPDRTGSPVNFPDTETNGKNLLFLHGANVSEENARAWMSETFKRFRQSGCAAKFHGVTWRSNIGNGANYQEDVSNAFVTAQWVAGYASTVGGKKVFAAHSLGNVVVSSALADWNMAADAYFMCNAAVTSEALDPEASTDSRLVHADWAKYPASLYSCNWFRNFSDNDSRHRLTWNGRFTNILDRVYNLYSSGDHCFELFSKGNPHFWSGLFSVDYFAERYCWQKQELGKGCLPSAQVLGKTEWAGWGFDKNWKGSKKKRPVPVDGEVIPPDELAQYPAFRLYPAWMNSPNLSSLQINSMLAQGIPTITPAVGNSDMENIFRNPDRNQDLNTPTFKSANWPNRGRDWGTRWLHGDIKDVAYFFNFRVFHFIVKEGELK